MLKSLLLLPSFCGLVVLIGCANGGGNPPPPVIASQFSLAPASAPTAGTPFNFTVTALGASGQTAASYSGTVRSTSTDPHPVLPAASMLMTVTATFTATL